MKKTALLSTICCFLFATAGFAQGDLHINLQKYDNDNLYEPTSENIMDVSGKWTGVEIQFDRTNTFITQKFEYELFIEQDGNKLSGTSYIADRNGQFAEMELRGYVIGNKFHFEEFEIADEQIDRNLSVWCLTTGELDIIIDQKVGFLVGKLDGYAADNYRSCTTTFVKLQKQIETEEVVNTEETSNQLLKQYMANENGFITTFPNPFAEKVTISYTLNEEATVLLEAFDLTGKKIDTFLNEKQVANIHQFEINADKIGENPGVYLLKLTVGDKVHTKQIVKTK